MYFTYIFKERAYSINTTCLLQIAGSPHTVKGNHQCLHNFLWRYMCKVTVVITWKFKVFWKAKRQSMIMPSRQGRMFGSSFLGSLQDFTNLSRQGICLQLCLVYYICPEGLGNASLLVVGHRFWKNWISLMMKLKYVCPKASLQNHITWIFK